MGQYLTRYFLLIVGCILFFHCPAQRADVIPDSGQQQLRSLPVEARDTVYRRWGSYFYARYTEEGLAKALECYTAALKIATKYNHEEVIRLSNYDLGTVYDAMNNYKKATSYYELFYQQQIQTGDPKRIFRSAYNLATVANKAGDKPTTKKYAQAMQLQLAKIPDRDYRLKGNLLLANLYSSCDDTAAFLYHYHLLPEDAVFVDEGLAFGRLYAEVKSNYLFYKGDFAASLKPLYNELAITDDSIPILTLIVKRQEETGDYKAALETKKVLDKTQAGRTSDALRNDIEKRLLGMDNELMERKNQLLQLQQHHLLLQRQQLYGIAALLLIGFLIATYSFFRIKNQNKQIGLQNQQIKRQHDNIDVLLHEVHHRVKNNLQIINSVVELQQLKPEVSPAESIKEMQIKMQSIALAHELMYEQQHIEYVPLQEYFLKLFSIILRIYGLSGKEVSCKIEMNNLKLTLDKTLLLALAVNELIINSFKHLYSMVAECKIELTCRSENDWYVFYYRDISATTEEEIANQDNSGVSRRLVVNLIKQLGGTVETSNTVEKLEYIFTFKP